MLLDMNYPLQLEHFQVFGVLEVVMLTHLKWNQFSQESHIIMFSSNDSGSLHTQ